MHCGLITTLLQSPIAAYRTTRCLWLLHVPCLCSSRGMRLSPRLRLVKNM